MNKLTHLKFNLNNFLLALSHPLDNVIPKNIYNTSYSSKRVAFVALNIAFYNDFTPSQMSDVLSFILLDKHQGTIKNISSFPFCNRLIFEEEKFKSILEVSNFIENNLDLENFFVINKYELIEMVEKLLIDEIIKENLLFIMEKESFWFDLLNDYRLPFLILDFLSDETIEISYEDLICIAKDISSIIYKYTKRENAVDIGELLDKSCKLYNFDEKDTSRMIVCGYLYNLGILMVNQNILDKTEPLNIFEYEVLKSIPYKTKQILSMVFGFDDIAKLASSVFERVDGSGYPDRLEGSELGLKNRILSVSVIFCALNEKRGYRGAYRYEEIKKILLELSKSGYLDNSVVGDFFLIHDNN